MDGFKDLKSGCPHPDPRHRAAHSFRERQGRKMAKMSEQNATPEVCTHWGRGEIRASEKGLAIVLFANVPGVSFCQRDVGTEGIPAALRSISSWTQALTRKRG